MTKIKLFKSETKKVDELIPYIHNPQDHPENQIDALASSFKKYGFDQDIIIDEDNEIIAGHGRILAAKKLGMDEISVKVQALSEADKRGRRLADNKIQRLAETNEENEALELAFLKENDYDFDSLGYDVKYVDQIIKDMTHEFEGETDPDELPEESNIQKRVSLGQLWRLGNHRLLCGDCTDKGQVDRLMDGEKADMVFTDPPYNIDYSNIKHPKFKVRQIENDNMSHDDFNVFCESFTVNIKDRCDGCIYVFGPPGPDGRIMFSALDRALHCSTTIVWNKDQFTLGRGKYQNKYEPCWFGWNKCGSTFIDDRKLTNVWDFARPKSSKLHPTMKPIELIESAIGHASKNGDVIFDLFLGSGSTIIAAQKTNRTCYGMELDPHYCDVILQRWEDFTGLKAELIEDAKS